eukprot:m.206844 g.206844  ORF g.206844 m.206844 type:complete len:81 (+) comp13758_c1_seq2:372-614(+)
MLRISQTRVMRVKLNGGSIREFGKNVMNDERAVKIGSSSTNSNIYSYNGEQHKGVDIKKAGRKQKKRKKEVSAQHIHKQE